MILNLQRFLSSNDFHIDNSNILIGGGNPNLKADNQKRIDKANAYAETLRGTISSFIKAGYTQRRIVDELNRINVKTARGFDFKLMTLQRVMKRLGLSTIYS